MDLITFVCINRQAYLEYNKNIRLLGVSIAILFTTIIYMLFEVSLLTFRVVDTELPGIYNPGERMFEVGIGSDRA